MFGWIRRLFAPPPPPEPRLSARVTRLENDLEDVFARVDHLSDALIKLRGRVTGAQRRSDPEPEQPETQQENGSAAALPTPMTAHLSRRFRSW